MAPYQVKIARSAAKDLKSLEKKDRKKILKALDKLQVTPHPRGVEKLTDCPGFLRLRAGDFRIIYTIMFDSLLVLVLVIRDRKDAYKGLDNLDHKLATAIRELTEHFETPGKPRPQS
ncbi:MAG: type II toxin-antitoxin system RelE/ParE family toxin [Rhodomicrobium sp.]|jgi:mRNA interferase RelE/StbE